MSFILDALRKSENARQRNGGPALAEVPFARRREGRPWWVWAIAALLGINLVVLLVVLLRSPEPATVTEGAPAPAAAAQLPAATPPPPAAVTVAAPPVQIAAAPAPAAVDSTAEPAMPARSLADEAASTGSPPPTDPSAPALAANVPNRAPIVRPLNSGAPGTTSQAGGEENLPTLNELTGDRAVSMPPMHLDIHVYSTNPAERFVFINMRKYTEGATLTEGPVLEKIRTDGVVLNQRGFRFVLPRQ
jgi:general secretion pathway protein B